MRLLLLENKIEEIRLFDSLPKDLNYSKIHTVLVQEVVKGNEKNTSPYSEYKLHCKLLGLQQITNGK